MIIEIRDETNVRLQKLAIPLTDTHETVVSRLLDHWAASHGEQRKNPAPGKPINTLADATKEFSAANPPDLGFTSCQQIVVDDVQLPRSETYWNSMMVAVIRRVHAKGHDAQSIRSMLAIANAEVGKKEDSGYKFLPDVGISIQGQDSNAAFRQTYQLAVFNGVKVSVFFKWQNNGKAAYPNELGYFEF